MRNILILSVSIFWSLLSHSQTFELRTYCFGNPSHKFIENLSSESKIILSDFLKKYEVDTSTSYRINYDEVFTKYGIRSYLSSHSYKYINWNKIDNVSSIREYTSINGYDYSKLDKIIILYSTNKMNVEDLSIYLLN